MISIDDVRKEIDQVDDALVQLIEQRARLVKSLISLKKRQGVRAKVPEREQEILQRLYDKHGESFNFQDLESIYKPIFEACVRLQSEELE